jgi:molybdopterin-biosynthesis enzyme MoeA-like protein
MKNPKQDEEQGEEQSDLTPAQIKMATLPSNAKLRYLSKDDWPVLQCRNVFVLPGVPEFFSKKIESVASYLSTQLERSLSYKVVLNVDEPSIVDILNDAVKKYPKVSFGSYPFGKFSRTVVCLLLAFRFISSLTFFGCFL